MQTFYTDLKHIEHEGFKVYHSRGLTEFYGTSKEGSILFEAECYKGKFRVKVRSYHDKVAKRTYTDRKYTEKYTKMVIEMAKKLYDAGMLIEAEFSI
jgi:hypothetical protein